MTGIFRGLPTASWARRLQRQALSLTRSAAVSGAKTFTRALLKPASKRSKPPSGAGAWLPGWVAGPAGAKAFRLYRPPGVEPGERLPLMVMLHGCGQDANSFAASTRMNRIALRERFLVLYPEQDRIANGQACWNWFDTKNGRAFGEASLILKAIDQVCLLHPVDSTRVVAAGLSAGASMAALLVTRHPQRFKALVMHSGVPPGNANSGLSALSAMSGRPAARRMTATPGIAAGEWPPLLVIHGAADTVVSPSNGLAAVQAWALAAGARGGAVRSVQRGKRRMMAVTDFERDGVPVATLAVVQGLGHAWSGDAASQAFGDAQGPDASRMAWAFAAKHLCPKAA